jgi:hypothetical protein
MTTHSEAADGRRRNLMERIIETLATGLGNGIGWLAALWAWETSWPILIRLTVVIGVAGWSLLIFVPKALQVRS